jgi:hypothetical protein
MRTKTRLALAGLTVVAAVSATTPAFAAADRSDARQSDRRCARQFDEAQRVDMESFRDYDLATWTASHDDDAITVLASGVWFQGRDRIAQVLRAHFENREAIWTWTELTRAVDGCRTATILYDATYAIPSANFTQRAYVSVVYTYKHGKWLSVIDQSTLVATP